MPTEQAALMLLTGVPVTLLVYAVLTYLQAYDDRNKAEEAKLDEYDFIRKKSIWGQIAPLADVLI